jgi:O-antigen ligase/tetratricopeptide (TPR) repeat protein
MKTLEQVLRWTVIAGIFALPFIVFIVASSLFFPFITGKNFAFRIIVEIITSGWLALALVYPHYRPRRSWMLLAFALFALIMAIADAQGVNPFKSFWSNFERMDGWVTLAHLFAYFVVATSVLSSKLWKYLWHTILGVSVLVSCYGLLQLAGLATINQGGVRLDATFGNATYLAVYMLFTVFMAAFFLARAWVDKGPGKRTGVVLLYGGIIALDFVIMFFTATRGAILGLIGGAVLAAILLVVQSPRSRNAWRLSAGIGVVIVLAGLFWAVRDASWIQRIEPLARIASISLSDGTTSSRFMNAGMALKGFEEKPLFGWGQENYAIVFDKYFDPNMYGQEPWFDRVHNIVFDWLVAGGILGLLAYLSLYVTALLALWRSSAFSHLERSILTGLFAGYFFYLLFTFDNVTSYILFATVLAYIAHRAAEADDAPRLWSGTVSLGSATLPVAAVCAIILAWGSAWYVNADALAQNRTLLMAIAPQGDVSKNLAYFKTAVSYQAPGLQEVREQLTQAASQLAANKDIPMATKQQFFTLTVDEMQKQMQMSPLDARFPLFLGILFDSYGDYPDATQALAKAHELSPRKQGILFQQAADAEARGDVQSELKFLKMAYDLAPAYKDARMYYAAALIKSGDEAQAEQLIAPLVQSGDAADARLAAAYAAKGQYQKIAALWTAHVAAYPNDLQGYFTLAAAYYAAGNSAQAIATLQAAEKQDASISGQAEQFIAQIKAGKK